MTGPGMTPAELAAAAAGSEALAMSLIRAEVEGDRRTMLALLGPSCTGDRHNELVSLAAVLAAFAGQLARAAGPGWWDLLASAEPGRAGAAGRDGQAANDQRPGQPGQPGPGRGPEHGGGRL